MAQYVIKFSDENICIDGRTVKEVQADEITRLNLMRKTNRVPELDEGEIAHINKSIVSKRKAEKQILDELLQSATKLSEYKGLGKFNSILDFASRVDNSDNMIEISTEEWDCLKKSFDELKDKAKDGIPAGWFKCRELFKQIEHPEEVKKPVEEKKAQ